MSSRNYFWKLKWLLALLLMMLLDFSPFPVSSLVLLYIFFFKPLWFKAVIDRLYQTNN